MNSPPKIKNPAPVADADHGESESSTLKAEHEPARCMSWLMPPDARDGFEIHIGSKGHVVMSQSRPFDHKSIIVLHPDEARALTKILPVAIAAANEFRKEVN